VALPNRPYRRLPSLLCRRFPNLRAPRLAKRKRGEPRCRCRLGSRRCSRLGSLRYGD
jgi:hypothetical protein